MMNVQEIPARQFDGGRLTLAACSVDRPEAALEVVMLGHTGPVSLEALLAAPRIRAEMAEVGYAQELERLQASGYATDSLFELPIPLRSLEEFKAIFPDADRETGYRTAIAGSQAWLPRAVADFFTPDGVPVAKKLWVIGVDPELGQRAFLPRAEDDWLQPAGNSAFTRALMLPSVGLMALPDLERLQVPATLVPVPPLHEPATVPQFLPCGESVDAEPPEILPDAESLPGPMPLLELLTPLLQSLARYRPDLHLLLALPIDHDAAGELPQASRRALADLQRLRGSHLAETLHRLQLLYPHLASIDVPVISASGLLAGVIATRTAQDGAWRSVAGRALPGLYQPFPAQSLKAATDLREAYGVGVLRSRNRRLELDDERLPGGVFGGRDAAACSGELARFLGWLRRELERLGRRLLFDASPGDPRPRLALEAFFGRLQRRGALRGGLPEDAFRVRERSGEGRLTFDIELALAYPIDRLRLHFNAEHLEMQHG